MRWLQGFGNALVYGDLGTHLCMLLRRTSLRVQKGRAATLPMLAGRGAVALSFHELNVAVTSGISDGFQDHRDHHGYQGYQGHQDAMRCHSNTPPSPHAEVIHGASAPTHAPQSLHSLGASHQSVTPAPMRRLKIFSSTWNLGEQVAVVMDLVHRSGGREVVTQSNPHLLWQLSLAHATPLPRPS